MFDRRKLGRVLDAVLPVVLPAVLPAVLPVVLLVAAGAGVVYAITIATTLQELRAREPIVLDSRLHAPPCPAATPAAPGDGEPGTGTAGAPPPAPAAAPERSGNCPPLSGPMRGQVRAQ